MSLLRLRIRPEAYHRLTLVALVSLMAIVVTGAAVRLTASGLGCSDWPGCTQDRFVPEADLHGWVEFGNRLVTGVVSVAVVLAVLGSWWRVPRRRDLVWLSWGLVVGVAAQVAIGAVTVLTHLSPGVVMAHFLVSMVLVADAVALHQRAGWADSTVSPDRRWTWPGAWVGRLLAVMVTMTALAVVTGTLVTAAGPHGGDEGVERFDVSISDVARMHGLSVAALVAATVAFLVLHGRRSGRDRVQRAAELLGLVLVAQATVGYVQYFNDVPALLVGVHVTGATLAWAAAVRLVLVASEPGGTEPRVRGEPARAGAALAVPASPTDEVLDPVG
jgi:heme a synthase